MISTRPTLTRDTPANVVLEAILSDRTRYPCLASMLYQLAEKLETQAPDIAKKCWTDVDALLHGDALAETARRLAREHGAGHSPEAHAFHRALLYLINQDELHRETYLSMDMWDRRRFVAERLHMAQDMTVEFEIAL